MRRKTRRASERIVSLGYINGMVDWQDPLCKKIIKHLPAGTKPGDYITSLEVTARKPGRCRD